MPGTVLLFHGKKYGDYHKKMDGTAYEKYYTSQILPNIPRGSVIVLDNASYHSVQCEKIPTKSNTKAVIKTWLTSKRVPFNEDCNKFELIEILNRVRQSYMKQYCIDKLAIEAGHKVLRLPLYHPELNPIENVWSQEKG